MNAVLILEGGNEFKARPHTVGTTEEELRSIATGQIAAARLQEIQLEMRRAAFALGAVAPESRC